MPILGILASSFAGAASDYESIATVTVGSGGASTVTFSSIPSTYTHLQLRITSKGTVTFADGLTIYAQINSDTGNNYAFHNVRGQGGAVFVAASSSTSSLQFNQMVGDATTSNQFGVAIIDFLDYTNTNKFKTARGLGGTDRNGTGNVLLQSGLWMNTNTVSNLSLTTDGNFVQHSHFALYGIRAA